VARLKEVGTYASGKTPKSCELQPSGFFPYFKVADMNTNGNEKYLITTQSYLPQAYNGITFSANSIVFPKNGGAVLTNKKRVLTRSSVVDLNTGVYTPTSLLDFDFVFHYFSMIDFSDKFKGGVIPTLDRSVIEDRVILIPPLSEQTRIVAAIEAAYKQLDEVTTNLN